MKKLLIAFSLLFLTNTNKAFGQITLEHTIDTLAFGLNFYPVNISNDETKYVVIDTLSNSFSLYNTDFSPFLTGINIPVAINPDWTIMYVTRSLFDCDSTSIEYALTTPVVPYNSFKVIRTDGNILLNVDSARGPYCYGCMGGSSDIRPITNTSEGAKLFLAIEHPVNPVITKIYSLCGTLPTQVFDFTYQQPAFVRVYPNPTAETVTFEMNIPGNIDNYRLILFDSNSAEVSNYSVRGSDIVNIDVNTLSNGTYHYRLLSADRKIQAGSFVISK